MQSMFIGRRDILGAAETGSGKTLAFGLPILTGILKIKEKLSASDESVQNTPDSDSEESEFEIDEDNMENNRM